jgi:hypothetical protein
VRPIQRFDLTVALDYGQFSLTGAYLPVGGDADPVRLVEEAIHGAGIAGSVGNEQVVVLSPHQNNFAMRLWVEVWPAEPADDLDDWQEALFTGLVVGASGLVYESPTLESATVPVPSGRYAVRITGRGFVNRGWPGSTTPGDEWRLQLWPARTPIRPQRLRSWKGPDGALAAEGSGWSGDLNALRAPDRFAEAHDGPAGRDPRRPQA